MPNIEPAPTANKIGLIGTARIVRACRVRHVQEVIFHSCEADIAKRVIVEVDRRAARADTYAPAEPVKRSSNQVCHSRAASFAGAHRESARPGLDLGGRERRIVKIPAIQFLPAAILGHFDPFLPPGLNGWCPFN